MLNPPFLASHLTCLTHWQSKEQFKSSLSQSLKFPNLMFLPTKNIWNHLLSPLWTPTNGAATGPQALGHVGKRKKQEVWYMQKYHVPLAFWSHWNHDMDFFTNLKWGLFFLLSADLPYTSTEFCWIGGVWPRIVLSSFGADSKEGVSKFRTPNLKWCITCKANIQNITPHFKSC